MAVISDIDLSLNDKLYDLKFEMEMLGHNLMKGRYYLSDRTDTTRDFKPEKGMRGQPPEAQIACLQHRIQHWHMKTMLDSCTAPVPRGQHFFLFGLDMSKLLLLHLQIASVRSLSIP
jgi:hypothetical protein